MLNKTKKHEKNLYPPHFLGLTLILLLFSCSIEKLEPDTVYNTEAKSGTFTKKVDLSELLDQIGTKDLKLIELIQNNPISKFKADAKLKTSSATSEFYFDTDNIKALKNDKNQAIYIIPVYKNPNIRDSNIYSISVNIYENKIDTKLNIQEISSDGPVKNTSKKFNSTNLNSETSKIKDVECICSATISDCTCHPGNHGAGGCEHPEIVIYCGECSGSSSFVVSSSNTTTGPTSTSSTYTTFWSSSASYAYNYNTIGTSINIALTKKYKPDYIFSSLQQYNIVHSPFISGPLLDFLNIEGSSQANKDFVVKIIDDYEDGIVSTYAEVNALLTAFKKNQEFIAFKNDYFITHPNTTLEQFENQFMGQSEGQDGTYDPAYWENPNLTFVPQNLPTYNNFVNAFPRNGLGQLLAGADIVYGYIGGDVGQLRFSDPANTENTCALKVSRALNYSGVIIPERYNPNGTKLTVKGADNKYYFLNSKALNIWMRKTFGIPSGSNHITGAQAGINGVNLPNLLNGKKGIYSLVSSNTRWAYGHADFLMPNATCGVYCHFYDAPIDYIDIWILN